MAFLEATEFKWTIAATLLHGVQYYRSTIRQSKTKYRLQRLENKDKAPFDRYSTRHPEMLAADRGFLNYQEQSIPFLTALWCNAIFVDPTKAGKWGLVWVVLRMMYPTLLGKELRNINPKRVLLVTGPCYLIVWYLFGGVAAAALQVESKVFPFAFALGFPVVAVAFA